MMNIMRHFSLARLSKSKNFIFGVAMVVTVLALSFGNSPAHSAGFVSSEVHFADASVSGLSIVPASCPSDPHYSGECSTSCSNGLNISQYASCACPSGKHQSGASCVADSCANGLNISAHPSCSCASGEHQSGASCVADSCANGLNISAHPSCNCPVNYVVQNGQCVLSCPAGQHAVGELCVCDSTNLQANSNGQCTAQVCSSGFILVNGQCVRENVCTLPVTCSDSTHTLNQCTNEQTDCAAINGEGWICDSGSCHAPPPPIASISAIPSLVPPGRTTNVAWTSSNTRSCSVSGTNGDGPWSGRSGSQASAAIRAQVIYTLTCVGLDGASITRTVTVNIIPNWHEQ